MTNYPAKYMDSSDPQIQSSIQKIEALPPISTEVRDLFYLVIRNSEDINLTEFVRLIECNPSITAKLIGAANSAFLRRLNPVTSVREAVVRSLGLKLSCSIVLSMLSTSSFNPSLCPSFDRKAYWERALFVAELNKRFCLLSNNPSLSADTAYLVGLLFNFGEFVLAHAIPEQYEAHISNNTETETLPRLLNEQSAFGVDSTMAGAIVATNWSLPSVVSTVMMHYPTSAYRGEDWAYSLMTNLTSEIHTRVLQEGGNWSITVEDHYLLTPLLISKEDIVMATNKTIEEKKSLSLLADLFSH